MAIITVKKPLPDVWTNELCQELFHHARDLGYNGNPGGYMLTVGMHPFVGGEGEGQRYIKRPSKWDYEGLRTWIAENMESVTLAWNREVVGS